jgi:hypothetical protein
MPRAADASNDDVGRAWLAHYGAPLYGSSVVQPDAVPKLEDVLSEGLDLAHRDAAVARALPVVLWSQRERLDLNVLARQARERGLERTLGFFLELTADLSGYDAFRTASDPLRSFVPLVPTDFFEVHGPLERAAAEANTPPLARQWGYLMNVGMDGFVSLFEKFVR